MAVYIIAHKEFAKPKLDGYKSLLVGAYKGHTSCELFDDEGENISDRNSSFCELTGIYWIWKHVKDDYIGIVHYRRYFSNAFVYGKIVSEIDIMKKLEKYDIILPFISRLPMTVEEHYCKESGFRKDLISVQEILKKEFPDYVKEYEILLKGKKIYFFNMMICRKRIFDEYCTWLFKILFELEKRVDLSEYNDYQKRIFGFLSERLLNVYVAHNHLKICEMGVINTEENWTCSKKILTGAKRWLLYRLQ